MTDNKTVPTDIDPRDFIAALESEKRREQSDTLLRFFERITGWPAQMWGDSIVGFGRYHYKYASGREGDFLITGFSPRKANLSLYIMPGFKQYGDQLARLGKHRHSVSCLYLTRLDTVDMNVLEEIVADSVERMKSMYEHWPQ